MTIEALVIAGPEELSRRERDVMVLIANGASNEDIAASLFLGLNTVKTYIRAAYRKIGATTRSQAIVWGAQHGLMRGVTPDPPARLVPSVAAA